MRDYSKVSSTIWTGKTGRAIRGDAQTQIVALYLMTSPHANMIGVYTCPIIYISHETGTPLQGASEGLERLIKAGFCTYEDDSELVWVHEMAKYQIGDDLKASDNQVKGVQKQYAEIPQGVIKQGFFNRYKDVFHLKQDGEIQAPLQAPLQAPCKPGTSTSTSTSTPPTPEGCGECFENPGQPTPDSKKQPPAEFTPGFAKFWQAWPSTDRKQARGKCFEVWKKAKLEADAAVICGHVDRMKTTEQWAKQAGQFIPAPLPYLREKRWDGADAVDSMPSAFSGGF